MTNNTNKKYVKQPYKKYNSFSGLRIKDKYGLNDFLKNIKLILNYLKSHLHHIFFLI